MMHADWLSIVMQGSYNEIYVMDCTTLKFVYVNQAAQENLQYAVNELGLMTPLNIACGLSAEGDGPWHVDLREVLAVQARGLGVGRISISSHCSAHDADSFFSHRRSRGQDGRMVAYLGFLP